MQAIEIYRAEFRPSEQLDAPRVMVGVPALAADSDEKAEYLATSMYQRSLGILKGERSPIKPPVRDMDALWNPAERLAVAERMALMVVGGPERVAAGLQAIVDATQADELIVVSDTFAREDRLRSFELIIAAARKGAAQAAA
jgi:alkanesulfonate monooxygenase SsuD/methylene tetrahydromethanopterin reductase-like flavin-dependent oxidoreductase (luciferase family)